MLTNFNNSFVIVFGNKLREKL